MMLVKLPLVKKDLKAQLSLLLKQFESSPTTLLSYEIADIYISLQNYKESLYYLLRVEIKEPSQKLYLIMAYLAFKQYEISQGINLLQKALNFKHGDPLYFDKERIEDLYKDLFIKEGLILKPESKKIFELLKELHINTPVFESDYDKDDLSQQGFQYIYDSQYNKAIEVLQSAKEQLGLHHKYPQIDNLSIEKWYEDFPNLEDQLAYKQESVKQGKASCQDYIEIGKMYLLKNDYSNASLFFTKARDLFLKQKQA